MGRGGIGEAPTRPFTLDAAAVVKDLRKVFATGKTKTMEWRLEQLNGLVRFAQERADEIAEVLKKDLNKPFHEATMYEIDGIRYSAETAAASLKEWMEPEKVSSPVAELANASVIPEPLGVALVISSWNFPFVLSLDPVIGAIAAGNCVAVKPSQMAPASSALLAKYIPMYVDSSAIKIVEGGIAESTSLIAQKWDKIFYTGSTRVGRIVMAAAAKYLTPVTLELGGKSPTIVDRTANLDIAARRIARGKWATNNGQICIAPDYVLAEESIVQELILKFKAAFKQFYGDDSDSTASSDRCRIVNIAQYKRLVGYLHDERTAEKIVHGGQMNEKTLNITPTLILDPPLDAPIMQEEIFGPLLVIITVKDVDDAIKFVNDRPKPLALYLFTKDQAVVEHVLANTSSGGVTVNDTLTHVRHFGLPFGGVGDSGTGSYHGKHSFIAFSHMKAVCYQSLNGDQASEYPPYKNFKKAGNTILAA